MDAAITLRKIAADCIKTVRSVTESEEEAVELIINIWSATASQVNHSLRVGKSLSLMPLGVLFMNSVGANGNEKEPALAVSELFIMQFGIAVKPIEQGSSPGPSTKPAYADIAAAVHVTDKAVIPNVLSALVHRLGEMCAQHPRVRVDFQPLGEIRCEQQRLEFVAAPQKKAEKPQSTEPKRTVRAMLARRRKEPLGYPGADDDTLADGGVDAEDSIVTQRPIMAQNSQLGAMVGKRLDLQFAQGGGQQFSISPRSHPASARGGAPDSENRSVQLSSRGEPRPIGAAQIESGSILNTAFQRSLPPKLMQFPPLLDEFSRTLAAPYGEELFNGSNCGRIASHFSPQAAMLVWSHDGKCLKWRAPPPKKERQDAGEGPKPDFAPSEIIEKEFENEKILQGSPLDLELREAKVSRRIFYGSLSRYRYYVSEGIKDGVVAPINVDWVKNVGGLVEAEKFFVDLSAEQADDILSAVHSEMMEGYFAATKKAIADYIFKDPHSRQRALVVLVPNSVPEWGSVPFVGIEGTVGGPPEEWRAGIEEKRESIVRGLTVCNQSSLRLLNLWHASGYSDVLLVELPQPAAPLVDIDRFFEKQKARCAEMVMKFKSQWFEDVCAILRDDKLHLNSSTEARFLNSISTLLAVQTRSAVQLTVDTFVKFFERFSKPTPLTPDEVTKMADTDEREDSFLTIKLAPRGEEIRLKDSLEKVAEKILRTFREFIICLNDIPLPETRLNRASALNKDKCLWGTSLEEQYVQQAEKVIDKIVNANMLNVEKSLRLYDEFTHLLAEEDRVKEFIKDPSKQSADEYLQRFNTLRSTEQKIRDQLPNEIRMQMASIDCVELNDTLRSKSAECIRILLDNIVTVNFDRNEKLCKSFDQIVMTLSKRPTGAGELVDLEQTLEQFRATTMNELLDEFADIRNWQQLLFNCQHELTPKDFKAITESAGWVAKIDGMMAARENDLRNERDGIENKFKVDRQKFEEDLAGSVAVVNKFKDAGNHKQMEEYLERILALKENFERAKFEADKLREKEVLLGWDASEFEKLQEGIEKLQPFDDLWELVYKFTNEEKKWTKGALFSIEPEAVDQQATNMLRRAMKLQSLFESMTMPTPAGVAKRVKKDLEAFKQHMPLVHALCNPGLRQRHWDDISEVVGFAMERDTAFTLSRVIDMDVGKHMKELQEISDSAAREYGLETTLEQISTQWEPIQFEVKPWKDTETYIVSSTTVDEMQSLMDDHIIKAQTMKGSPYAKPFFEKICEIESWLVNTQEVMDMWMKVQSVWLYLEPIFGSEDIVKQMPTEANLFKKVDANWRSTMSMAKESGQAMQVTKAEGLMTKLSECNEHLETVQKGLNDYLETKRLAFPRFFFLSNDNLLEILSETKDPTKVNPHMKKAFEGIQSLEFDAGNKIVAMLSSEKEKVPVVTVVDPAKARGNVEQWLVEVEATMLETIRHVSLQASEDFTGRKFTEWLKVWPGQVVIAIFCLYWTIEVSTGLRNEGNVGVRRYGEKLEVQLAEIIDLVRNDLPPLVRCTLQALIVIFVHNKDTVMDLTTRGTEKEEDFDWLVQLRYFIEENPDKPDQTDVFVRITNSFLSYAYEYIGNSDRLVVTPLTDRCYRTCCGALHLLYGAAPEGPAGTGKTETVKDLAKALARFCVVFNCSDELDFLAMAKFFKGLAASGGWACFDEFNRIDAEVLSVVAQQILCIQTAIKERKTVFEFEGTTLPIIWTCNCFITMNPGYAGRAELPDNLKALFRTVAMMVPDYAMIAEIKMYAFGYEDARNLAQKIVTTYKLCSEQLSSQKHYDYGMRAVFAVLVRAGSLKRSQPTQSESILMLQSINDVNLAKFLNFDVPLYDGITKDLFPGVELPKQDYSVLIDKLTENLNANGNQAHPYFIDKIIQFYECHLVRHSIMLVGMPFSGKTVALNTLQKSLTDLANDGSMHAGCIVHQCRLNPKSIPAKDLYGGFDPISHEWTDGIVAVLFREMARNQTEERKWLVFDGPVDAIWIENMNTVMDENKKLCLNSGEIIAMSANMRTIIEPMDVEVASPATISRNGMVFYEPHLMGFQHLIDKTFLGGVTKQLSEEHHDQAKLMIEFLAGPLITCAQDQCKLVSPCQEQNLVQSFLGMFTTHVELALKDEKYQQETGDAKAITSMLDCFAVFSAIWSIGAACETASRPVFGAYMRKLLSGGIDAHKPFKKVAPALPDRGSIYDYCFDLQSTGWTTWNDTCEQQVIDNKAQAETIIVQTIDNIRYRYILNHSITNNIKLLFCGPTGTGKTVYMQQAMMALSKEEFMQVFIGFSAQTKCSQTQDLVDAKLERRRKGVFGPPMGKHCVVMVDDLNMPTKETFGAQPPIEILRQSIDKEAYAPTGGWFDRADSTHPFRSIIDVLLFAAMGPPGGGRTFITPRILGHFHLVGFPLLDDENMQAIFNTILDWKFRVEQYPGDVASMTKKLVQGTLEIYKATSAELLPTPLKVHYTFNLRDFAKVIFGLLLLKKTECEGPDRQVRLWVHEIWRVFGDRLIDETDRKWMLLQQRELTKKIFQLSFDDIFSHLDANEDGKVDTLDEIRELFFGDMMSQPQIPKRPYAECPDAEAMQKEIEAHLNTYNEMSNKPMELVCFLYMLEHLSRTARVIKSPGGNALLVGVGGSGRQSCARLACFLADFQVFQIEIAKGYDMIAFREDMKKMLTGAGGNGDHTVFLFNDSQIKDEGFVEDVNNLLNTGEIPNLFPPEERIAICEMVRNAAREEGKAPDGTPTQLFGFFLDRCKSLLGCVVCFSPIGDAWRSRLRQFPSLVNCCTIDWYTAWPVDALQAVAERSFKDIPDLDDSLRQSAVEMCQAFHSGAGELAMRFKLELKRIYYSTPTSFLELISTLKAMLADKRKLVGGLISKYAVGLEKLTTTEQSVEGMKQDLIALQPQLVEKNKEVGEMMIVVNEESAKTESVKEVVAADEAVASEAANKANAIKEECEKELDEAMPALNDALKALDTLSSKEISEIKAMKNPPAPVRLVLSAVCILRQLKPVRVKDDAGKMVDDYWPAATKMISEMGFLQSLQAFDKENIPAAIIQKIATMTPKEDFQPDRVERVSKAAWGLCMWCRAMETYDRVAKVVAPKKETLKEAEEEYATVMVDLNQKRAELKKVVDELDALNAKLDGLKKEQDDLTCQVDLCQKKLERAETLISSLGGEKIRWTQNEKDLKVDYVNLTGDVIVASGIIAYLGAFTPDFREGAVKDWVAQSKDKNIPGSDQFSLEKCLGEPVKIRSWCIAGLPNDAFSIENGIIVDKSRRWPLCIDPQGQANKWIKKYNNHITVQKFSDGDYLKRLEGCVQFGNAMLIENIAEELDPAIEPILLRQTFKKGNTLMVKLGEAIVEWEKNFKFFMTTKLRNPHYLPEVAVKVTLLNFMITQVGLQDQLLNIVVEKERPDLAEEKARLVVEGAENKEQLEVTENKILDVLSSSQGNILEDETAVQILSASKQLSNEIAEKQKIAEQTEAQIDEARLQYVPVSFKTAILFFVIADLANIDPMYQYSLPFFMNLFKSAIDKSEPSSSIEVRIENLNDFFMMMLYNNICRSLFEKDKLLFSFLLCTRIELTTEAISMMDYRFLLTGGVSMDEPPPKPADWITDRCWSEFFRFGQLDDKYAAIPNTFKVENAVWNRIYDSSDPLKIMQDEDEQPRCLVGLDRFQELCALRCIRPDRVLPAVLLYVAERLGEKFVTPPPFDLAGSYSDSSNIAPLIFILSPGADPFSALFMFATERGKDASMASISLGQGQGPKAEKIMEEAMQNGGWVLLQNCHLATSWMPKLDKILETLDPRQVSSDFRLWLSSYPSSKFPVAILQNSVKITNEAPKGLRANLIGSFLMDPISNQEDFFEKCEVPETFKKLLFSLCFFHAVIQERRLFGPLGWNIPYEFTQNDLRISARQLKMFLDENVNEVPFKALNYLTGECNYGGRVTDDKDRRLLITLLADYYSPDALVDGVSLCAEHSEYMCPTVGGYDSMLEQIKDMSLVDPPGVFGFHENANLTREQNETYLMMDNLLLMVGSSSGGGGAGPEDVIRDLSEDIVTRMPEPFKLLIVEEKYPTMYEESMNTVLLQELQRFNGLVSTIRSSLVDIQKSLKGLLLMSLQLEKMFYSLFDGKTPEMWLAVSYPSLKPLGSYTNDLIARLEFFQKWIDNGIPITFWFSGIFFTQAFTTGAAQNFARKYTIPIDTLTFDFEMPKEQQPAEKPPNGVYTYGVFLEGCKWCWEKWELRESDPKVLFVSVPLIYIIPCKKTDVKEFSNYDCPMYKISTRKGTLSTTGHSTNFVMFMRLASSEPESHWVKRGVAMLTQLDS